MIFFLWIKLLCTTEQTNYLFVYFYCQMSHLVTAVHPIRARAVSSCRGEQRCIAVFN